MTEANSKSFWVQNRSLPLFIFDGCYFVLLLIFMIKRTSDESDANYEENKRENMLVLGFLAAIIARFFLGFVFKIMIAEFCKRWTSSAGMLLTFALRYFGTIAIVLYLVACYMYLGMS